MSWVVTETYKRLSQGCFFVVSRAAHCVSSLNSMEVNIRNCSLYLANTICFAHTKERGVER